MKEPPGNESPRDVSQSTGRINGFLRRFKPWAASIQRTISLETPAEQAEKAFFALYPRTPPQQELEKFVAEVLTYVAMSIPAVIVIAWLILALMIPMSLAKTLPHNYYMWFAPVYLLLFASTLQRCVERLREGAARLFARFFLKGFERSDPPIPADPSAFRTGLSLRLAVQLDGLQSKPEILRAKASSALDWVLSSRSPHNKERADDSMPIVEDSGQPGGQPLQHDDNGTQMKTTTPPPTQSVPRESFLWQQLQRQSAPFAAAVGAINMTGTAVLKGGAALTAIATLSGATLSVDLLRSLGVNPYDYISITDLPALGLRFWNEFALTFGFFGAMTVWTAFSAWTAAHAVQSHRAAVGGAVSEGAWHRVATWMSSAWMQKEGYLMPAIVAAACMLVVIQVVPRAQAMNLAWIKSDDACTNYVTWQKDAWPSEAPFPSSQCVALVGMLGTNAVFVVHGTTHIVPRDKIASMRVERRQSSTASGTAATTAP